MRTRAAAAAAAAAAVSSSSKPTPSPSTVPNLHAAADQQQQENPIENTRKVVGSRSRSNKRKRKEEDHDEEDGPRVTADPVRSSSSTNPAAVISASQTPTRTTATSDGGGGRRRRQSQRLQNQIQIQQRLVHIKKENREEAGKTVAAGIVGRKHTEQSPFTGRPKQTRIARQIKKEEEDVEDENHELVAPTKECLICRTYGRLQEGAPEVAAFDEDQFLPIVLKPKVNKLRKNTHTKKQQTTTRLDTKQKIIVGYIHQCCAVRAPPQKKTKQDTKTKTKTKTSSGSWWSTMTEVTHGHPGLVENPHIPINTLDSTAPNFVPYLMTFDRWMDEFCVYNYRMLLGSLRRFYDTRGPPYNMVGSSAALWRCDDRGSIGFARMVQTLTHRQQQEWHQQQPQPEPTRPLTTPTHTKRSRTSATAPHNSGVVHLTEAATVLWGAIVYRVFNRLSLFSRWAALRQLSHDTQQSVSQLLRSGHYETRVFGGRAIKTGTRTTTNSSSKVKGSSMKENSNSNNNNNKVVVDYHAIAASGVTLLGRMGCRDVWGKDFCLNQMNHSNHSNQKASSSPNDIEEKNKDAPSTSSSSSVPSLMMCVSQLPLPHEWEDFKLFTHHEKCRMGRGVLTGEHQTQPYFGVLATLTKLISNECSQLKSMSAKFMTIGTIAKETDTTRTATTATPAQYVLDTLKNELHHVADFFAWQIFSDLVCVQYYCQLYPDDTILPMCVVHDSRYHHARFGPGARKGAEIIFGGAADQLEYNRNVPQGKTIQRAVEIRKRFEDALRRTKLDTSWKNLSFGRDYDLETVEHSLCGFYGVMHNLNMNVLLSNTKLYTAMEKIANEKNCSWPPGNEGAASRSSLPPKTTKRELLASTTKSSKSTAASKIQQRQTIGRWKPHPCTDLERNDLLNRVKLAGHYRHCRTEEGNKCGTTFLTEESKWDVIQLDFKNNQYTSRNTAGIDRKVRVEEAIGSKFTASNDYNYN